MRRLFFAFEVTTPANLKLPPGRLLAEKERHITLAFLGEVDYNLLQLHLDRLPKPDFTDGFVGEFTEVAFFPPSHPRAVVWKAIFHRKERAIRAFQQKLTDWLRVIGFPPTDPDREWVPHVTLCRAPFDSHKWSENFEPRPFMITKFHLYESIGDLRYHPLWTYTLLPPFEEQEDDVIKIRGHNPLELVDHAQVALALRFPVIWEFIKQTSPSPGTLEAIQCLNSSISSANAKYGLNLKSVESVESFKQHDEKSLEWRIKMMYQKGEGK